MIARLSAPWVEPLHVAWGLREHDGLLALLSDGGEMGRRSWIGLHPDVVFEGAVEDDALFAPLGGSDFVDGVVVGLASYDAGARPATGDRGGGWPDLMLARYPAILCFDHATRRAEALGFGEAALARAQAALVWLEAACAPPLLDPCAEDFTPEAPPEAYEAAVGDVVRRIGEGELFQANIARAWTGRLRPGARPLEVLARLGERQAAFGAAWRLGDRAVVSNSPELFLTFDAAARRIETRPIKGTRARLTDPSADVAAAQALRDSAKDRAENLMIVDLMRNDLARVAEAGSVRVERLFEIETLPTVHHLVSTVTATAAPGVGPGELLQAAFPPGSITGAPKHQAMKVIAGHEPPRGPWCGSLFLIEPDGDLTASVLIRTAAFERDAEGWRFRTLAGAGIVADSDPALELAETEAKIRALKEALIGP